MKTITRRTALAASVSLPLLPVASYATPADPVVTSFSEWKALYRERMRVHDVFMDMEERHGTFTTQSLAYQAETVAPVYKRTDAIERRIAEMIATTLAGLAAQVRITMERFGYDNGGGMEQVEGRLLRNMLTGAEGMANA